MCVEVGLDFLVTISSHTANLHEAFRVARGNLSAIIVELAIVDVVFVTCVESECVRSSLVGSVGSSWLVLLLLSRISQGLHS